MICNRLLLFAVLLFACAYGSDKTCKVSDKAVGTCKPAKDCHKVAEIPKDSTDSCHAKGETTVCCLDKAEPGIITKKKCEEIKKLYTDGKDDGKDGEFAKPKEFPHMAILGYGPLNDTQWLCAGSLISDQFVLVPAHCLISAQHGPVQGIRLGDLNINVTEKDPHLQFIGVKSAFKQPDFKPPQKYNNLALLQLIESVKFTDYVKPACLNTEQHLPDKIKLTSTGWGPKDAEGEILNGMQKISVKLLKNSECAKDFPVHEKTLKDGLDGKMMCVGGRNCQITGGPMQFKNADNKGSTIVAVGSFGKSCGPIEKDIYTDVVPYLDWIERVVWSH